MFLSESVQNFFKNVKCLTLAMTMFSEKFKMCEQKKCEVYLKDLRDHTLLIDSVIHHSTYYAFLGHFDH